LYYLQSPRRGETGQTIWIGSPYLAQSTTDPGMTI
jgi:hypothetical protein